MKKKLFARYNKSVIALFFFLVLGIFFLRNILFLPGSVGLKDDWSVGYFAEDIVNYGNKYTHYWMPDNLGHPLSYEADLPLKLLQIPLGMIGVSGEIFSKSFLLLALTFSGFFMYLFIKDLKIKFAPSIFSGVLYAYTPMVFNSMVSGYFSYLFFYSLAPLVLLYFFRMVRSDFENSKELVLYGLLLGISTVHVQGIFLLNFISFTYLIFHHFFVKRLSLKGIVKFSLSSLLSLFYNMFWIMPATSDLGSLYSTVSSKTQSWIFLTNPPLLKSIMMFGGGYTYFDTTLKLSGYFLFWVLSYFLILAMSFTYLIMKKNKFTLYFAVIFLLSLFLYKGQNPPFESISLWIYQHTLIGSLFRNSQYLVFLLIVPISVLFAHFLHTVSECNFFKDRRRYFLFLFLIIIPVSLYPLPYYNGALNKQVNLFFMDESYVKMNNFLSASNIDSRVLFLPMSQPVEYKNIQPQIQEYKQGAFGLVYGLNPLILSSEKPTLGNLFDEGTVIDALSKSFYTKNPQTASNLSKIMGLLNIKYVVFTEDFISRTPYFMPSSFSDQYNWTNERLKEILFTQNSLTQIQNISNKIFVFSNDNFLPHIHAVSTPILVSGTIDEMFPIVASDYFTIGNNAIFLLNQTNKEQLQLLKENNNSIFINEQIANVPSYNGLEKLFDWSTNSLNNYVEARYYVGWKSIVRTDGKEVENTMSFPSLDKCPYVFPTYSLGHWNGLNSTLIYIKTGSQPLRIDEIIENAKPVEDVSEIWWETGWMGMTTKPVSFPVTIPPNQRAIIQINHIIQNNTTLRCLELPDFSKINVAKSSISQIISKEINPTKYEVKIENATAPYFLVFSENFDSQWKIFVEGSSIDDKNHFIANGYANSWYINKTGTYTITLEFWPQKLFYTGSAISITTLILCTLYISKDKIKIIYQKYIKNKQVPQNRLNTSKD